MQEEVIKIFSVMMYIEEKDKHTFLSKNWCKMLQEAGIDMSDGRYVICQTFYRKTWEVISKDELSLRSVQPREVINTYTLPELIYKLSEYGYINEGEGKEKEDIGLLKFLKDAPFYLFYYSKKEEEICGECETPIEAAASLLLQCVKNKVGFVRNISDKYDEYNGDK